ncbi:MAG: hypothetical protein QHI48_03585 [Bacteroidota bacterium]|nr:hypothetical protein [Bacteroidota bacterium]
MRPAFLIFFKAQEFREDHLFVSVILVVVFSLATLRATGQDLASPDLRPFTLTGTLVTSAENNSIPGMQTQRPVNTARLYFNPTVTIYGVSLPFSFLLSTNERSYNQPLNQFGVSPTYKGFTLHAGYRSLRFSEFSLSDAVFLGAGAEMRVAWFHGGAIYGRLRRSIREDTAQGIQPVFKRMGYAVKIGFGSEQNFLDVNVLNAWDDSTSLPSPPARYTVFPEENLITGLNGRVAMFDGRLFFEGEAAASFVTRDMRQPSVSNAEVTALDAGIFDTRLSSRVTFAFKTAGTWNEKAYTVRLEYTRVEPEFESFGTSYTQSDREDITIAPSVRLFEGKLRAGGSIGFRRDNILNDRGYTTHRVISAMNINWAPSTAFGIDGQYSNYSMSNSSAAIALNDTTRIENVTQSFTLSPRYLLMTNSMQHFFLFFLTRQTYADRNILTRKLSNNDVTTGMLNYSGTMRNGLGCSAALQYTEVHTAYATNIIRGATVGLNKAFFKNSFSTGLSYTFNLTQASTESAIDRQHLVTLQGLYRLTRVDQFELRFQYNSYRAANPSRVSYSGTSSRLQYSRAFAFGTK